MQILIMQLLKCTSWNSSAGTNLLTSNAFEISFEDFDPIHFKTQSETSL